MKSTGIVRRVDELGRVVIPIELRNKFDIKEKDQVDNPQLFSLIVVEDKGQLKIEESL